ncbi:heterodimeric methylmalonyl-CoA mutase small subunit [Fodinibius salinus]|uniref:methylmalonyl-CoA mutase n=1 Tax=Fodinibius salinus TaxID=860790 RepID=A0A5D3YJG0_9BACT|nr:methylmalonyl-CoA mutase family protein [Fodinibius salinus]TYP93984.1 heterodimeric methylmalonyl-CoA mutase small subunit [Fodinibius salinus]
MSDSETTNKSLFEDFPPTSTEEWEHVIKQDLNGADYKQELRWDTGEGLSPLPFYRREDLDKIPRHSAIPKEYAGENPNDWEIREPIFANTIEEANSSAKHALSRGANALQFYLTLQRTEGALGGDLKGIPIQNQEDFSNLVADISLEDTAFHFDAGLASPALLGMLWNTTQQQNLNPQKVRATFSYDPFVYLLEHGHLPKDKQQLRHDICQLTEFTNDNLPAARPLSIDARFYHNTGSTLVQELGYALAAAAEYLSILTENKFNINEVTDRLHFSFSVGSNYFLEIAKFRAARLLWKNLIEAFGADSEHNEAYLHGQSSRWNKTLYDPYTNMLRTSTEGMSAAIAGCDSMTIMPFDEHFRQPNEFSQRIARNQQLILSEESYLNKVADPAAGSYYIEKLTDQIGKAAWQVFQQVEVEGGLLQAIENGTVQSAIQKSQQKRDQAIASRERTFVGTNQYSNDEDTMADQMDSPYKIVSLNTSEKEFKIDINNFPENLASAFAKGATLGDVASQLVDVGKTLYRTVQPYRGTQAFEELRLATEHHDSTPLVLNLPLGNKKWRKGRSAFSANFFGCAGYDIEDPIGFADADAALEAVEQQQPDIVVICSSDKEYPKLVPTICDGLKELDNQPIAVLAGNPKKDTDTFKKAGIDEFIYSGCNVLETLKKFQQKLKIIE